MLFHARSPTQKAGAHPLGAGDSAAPRKESLPKPHVGRKTIFKLSMPFLLEEDGEAPRSRCDLCYFFCGV
jgi:hypothetical protein